MKTALKITLFLCLIISSCVSTQTNNTADTFVPRKLPIDTVIRKTNKTTDTSAYKILPLDTVFRIRPYQFALDSTNWLDKGMPRYFDSVARFINSHPYNVFRVENHTDCRADKKYNLRLSQRRADTVYYSLIKAGANPRQLKSKGMGESDLLLKKCNCDLKDMQKVCTEKEHQMNRRTTLKVIKVKRKKIGREAEIKTNNDQGPL